MIYGTYNVDLDIWVVVCVGGDHDIWVMVAVVVVGWVP